MESLGETGSSPRIDRMVARCKVAGAGRESQISFNSQPQAYRPLKLALNPVRLRLTVKRDQPYNLIGIASDFVVLVLVLVLSPPRRTVLSETVLVLDGCLN
jgi:hypothetical protein